MRRYYDLPKVFHLLDQDLLDYRGFFLDVNSFSLLDRCQNRLVSHLWMNWFLYYGKNEWKKRSMLLQGLG